MKEAPITFPLFKGACREPTYWGVPRTPFVLACMAVATLACFISFWLALLIFAIVPAMREFTRKDDRAFTIWYLWLITTGVNRNKKFWGASSYAPITYRDRFVK